MISSVRKGQYRPIGAFTLVEMLTVVTIAAIMMVIAVPNITSMVRNASMTNARNLVKTALSQAQSYAVRNGVHAGIRFQKAANGKTYLVLIENAKSFDYWNGTNKSKQYSSQRFVAIPNAKPKALPNGIAAVSASLDRDWNDDDLLDYNYDQLFLPYNLVTDNFFNCIENQQTFSIVFAPSGQLVTKDVCVEPRRGEGGNLSFKQVSGVITLLPDGLYGDTTDIQYTVDSVFGSIYFTDSDFYEKKYPTGPVVKPQYRIEKRALLSFDNFWVSSWVDSIAAYPWCRGATLTGGEPSATSLILYMEDELKSADETGTNRYTNFFSQSSYSWGVDGLGNQVATGVNKREGCEHLLINRYTGELIEIQ